jgi:ABC-type sugar transport system permease subunit
VHRLRNGIGIVTMILFLPYAIPSIVAVVVWRFLLEDHGLFAVLLEKNAGIQAGIWMGDWIFVTLIVVSVWQFYPFVFITLLARMRRIPPALYRSAQLDGAGIWQQFRFVTLPAIKSTLIVVTTLRLAFMFTKFDTPWLLGGRTANEGVRTLPIYIYQRTGMDIAAKPGIAAAVIMALLLFIPITALWITQWMIKKRRGEEDSCE